jgi:hypothetical protein
MFNTLDGFNLQPRLAIPFDGPIDGASLTAESVFLSKLDDAFSPRDHARRFIGINQIVWDIATTTLYAESDEMLEQHTRYALFVRRGLRDVAGNLVGPSDEFSRLRRAWNVDRSNEAGDPSYRSELVDAITAAHWAGIHARDIIAASVFTTQSITAPLERIRRQLDGFVPQDADFELGLDGSRTVFPLNAITAIAATNQTRADGASPSVVALPVSLLQLVPGSVGEVAFGKYVSPNYLTSEVIIPAVGTRVGRPSVQSWSDVYFNLYIPSGTRPLAGWPVAIFGHGRNGDKNFSMRVAAAMAARGIATISINAIGHGYGPASVLTVTRSDQTRVTCREAGDRPVCERRSEHRQPVGHSHPESWQLNDCGVLFRNDLAFAENPTMPKNPHRFMVNVDIPSARALALAAQRQIAEFFASGGVVRVQPEPIHFFEMPMTALPEDLSFIP